MTDDTRRPIPTSTPTRTLGALCAHFGKALGITGVVAAAAAFAACSSGAEGAWPKGAADGGTSAATGSGSGGATTGGGGLTTGGGGTASTGGGGGADGGVGVGVGVGSSGDAGSPSSSGLPSSRLIGGATLDPNSFWPPTGQDCTTTLDASGTVPTSAPQAFLDECSGCHGPTGAGHDGYPAIGGLNLPFSAFQSIVRTGIVTATAEMPFFKPTWLNDDDLNRIFAFLMQQPIVENKVCTPLPVPTAAEITAATTAGMTTWRTPDGKTDPAGIKTNVACANCHAPDPLDIAYYGFQDGDILRRGLQHLPTTQIANIVDFVHALRAEYSIGRRDPLQVRPFQPGGGLLPGDGIVARDGAFGQELVSMGLTVATTPINSVAQADAALAQFWAIDRHSLRIPIPFNRYAEDVFHNPDGYVPDCSADIDGCDDHGSIADWISVAPHFYSDQATYYSMTDAYLATPNDTTESSLRYAAGSTTMPGTYAYGTASFDVNKYQSLVLGNYCIRLEVTGQTGCYDKGVAPFPNKADPWNIGGEINLFGTNYEAYPTCDTTWQGCGDAPANLPVWPQVLLDDITPGATLSSNFSRLRHPWMTLWWTHFDPTLLVTGDPTAQKDEYFTRSIWWSNDNDEVFDGTPTSKINPTYGIFPAYEVMMHNVATLENPSMASCSLWPAGDFPCTAVDVRSGYYPDVINFAEQNQPGNPESDNNVHYQTLLEPTDSVRRPTYQLLVANLYRLFFWETIGAMQKDNWMCYPALETLRMTRAQEFLTAAETQAGNAAQDKVMFDTLNGLMATATASCPPQ